MKINRNNYEEFFFDYAEGNLTASGQEEVRKFLEQNPHLKPELEAFEKAYLVPDEAIVFKAKQKLKQKEGGQIRWLYYTVGSVAAAVILMLIFFDPDTRLNIGQDQPQLAENKPEANGQEDSTRKETPAVSEKENKTEEKKDQAPVKENMTEERKKQAEITPGKTAAPAKAKKEPLPEPDRILKKTDITPVPEQEEAKKKKIEFIKPATLTAFSEEKEAPVEMPVAEVITNAAYADNRIKNTSKSEISNLWDVAEKVVAFADKKVKPTLELQQEQATNDNDVIAVNLQFGKFGFSKKFRKKD